MKYIIKINGIDLEAKNSREATTVIKSLDKRQYNHGLYDEMGRRLKQQYRVLRNGMVPVDEPTLLNGETGEPVIINE